MVIDDFLSRPAPGNPHLSSQFTLNTIATDALDYLSVVDCLYQMTDTLTPDVARTVGFRVAGKSVTFSLIGVPISDDEQELWGE